MEKKRVVPPLAGSSPPRKETPARHNGGVAIAWQIDPEGRVHEARIVDDDIGSNLLDECILREASSWRFDGSDRPTDIGSYPFKFGVRRPDAAR